MYLWSEDELRLLAEAARAGLNLNVLLRIKAIWATLEPKGLERLPYLVPTVHTPYHYKNGEGLYEVHPDCDRRNSGKHSYSSYAFAVTCPECKSLSNA
jgi:hypothetical protein